MIVSSAQAFDLRIVRVTFSGAVPQVDQTAAGDALNPENYAITATTAVGGLVPSAEVHAVNAATVSTTVVEIATDTDLSPGMPYKVAASNITGLSPSPSESAPFDAFSPPQPAGRSFAITRMIPKKNWREDDTGDLARFVGCLQDQMLILLTTVDRWSDIIDPEKAPERFVDSMLVDMGNPFPFQDMSIVDKRRLLLALIRIYQLKGTIPGIRAVIRFFTGLDVDVIPFGGGNAMRLGPTGPSCLGPNGSPPWILGSDGAACQFEIKIGVPWVTSDWGLSAVTVERIQAIVKYMKPANMILIDTLHPRLPAPIAITIMSPAAGSVALFWQQLTGQNGYHVYWRYSPGANYRNGTLVATGEGIAVAGWSATSGARIYCVVMGVDENGYEGVASEEVSIVVT